VTWAPSGQFVASLEHGVTAPPKSQPQRAEVLSRSHIVVYRVDLETASIVSDLDLGQVENVRQRGEFEQIGDSLPDLVWSPDGQRIAVEVVAQNGTRSIQVWDVTHGKQLMTIPGSTPRWALDGRLFVSHIHLTTPGAADPGPTQIQVWDSTLGTQLPAHLAGNVDGSMSGPSPQQSYEWQGTSAYWFPTAQRFTLGLNRYQERWPNQPNDYSVAPEPGRPGVLVVWDVANAKQLAAYDMLAFSSAPDGQRLVIAEVPPARLWTDDGRGALQLPWKIYCL
jgi:hypothetical protein